MLDTADIVRETDAARINAVVNHESVRPHVTLPGQAAIDLADVVADPGNVVLMLADGSGGIVFHRHEPGVYEAHTQFLPDARGPACLAAVQAMLDWLYLSTDAMEVVTKCPAGNRPAEALARAVGGRLDFAREAAWPTDRGLVAVRYYALRYPDWAARSAILPGLGRWFHDRLEAEDARVGRPDELHDDDPAHDRHVGAAVGMMLCGQAPKAVVLYNRWARFAGYAPVALRSLDPLVVDIGTHVLAVRNGDLEALSCP